MIGSQDAREILSDFGQEFAGKRVLVTGAAGFLGKWFCEVLRRAEAEVIGIDIVDGPNVVTYDVSSEGPPRLRAPWHFVLHAAGNASPRTYRAKPLETLEVSHMGTRNVLDAARDCGSRAIIFSSSEIYGDPTVVPTPETYRGNVDCLGPRACYDEGKRVAETITRIYAERFGVEAMIVRPFNVFGPGMSLQDYRVLPNIAASLRDKSEIVIYGNGQQTRTFCYVTDAIRAVLTVLLRGEKGEAYNVGNPTPEITMEGLARRCLAVTGETVPIVLRAPPESYPGDEPQRRCPDIGKVRKLGYEPRVDLTEGLGRFFRSAL